MELRIAHGKARREIMGDSPNHDASASNHRMICTWRCMICLRHGSAIPRGNDLASP
ncbi:MAG: hypothetical protein IJN47_05870 [Clostridia bacterium]|nr:hypothetical protein [Clostridia bacterium]